MQQILLAFLQQMSGGDRPPRRTTAAPPSAPDAKFRPQIPRLATLATWAISNDIGVRPDYWETQRERLAVAPHYNMRPDGLFRVSIVPAGATHVRAGCLHYYYFDYKNRTWAHNLLTGATTSCERLMDMKFGHDYLLAWPVDVSPSPCRLYAPDLTLRDKLPTGAMINASRKCFSVARGSIRTIRSPTNELLLTMPSTHYVWDAPGGLWNEDEKDIHAPDGTVYTNMTSYCAVPDYIVLNTRTARRSPSVVVTTGRIYHVTGPIIDRFLTDAGALLQTADGWALYTTERVVPLLGVAAYHADRYLIWKTADNMCHFLTRNLELISEAPDLAEPGMSTATVREVYEQYFKTLRDYDYPLQWFDLTLLEQLDCRKNVFTLL